jgi:SSS family transporter
MTAVDYTIFLAYLAGVLLLGWVVHRRDRSGRDFFLAGRSMGWLPVGISVMVTAFSAINYLVVPAAVFRLGLRLLISLPVFFIVAWPVTRVFLPFYRSMELTSAYEYLEHRFDVRVRSLGSGAFILWRTVWMAVALLACAMLLGAVTERPVHWVILLAGGTAVAYSAFGGMRAVMWTDVAQFGVLLIGIVAGVALAAGRDPGGFAGMLETARQGEVLRPLSPPTARFLSPDPRLPITLWSGLIGTFVAFLARYTADQVVVQRYFSARSLRDVRRAFWLNATAAVVAIGLLVLLGIAVYAHSARAGLLGKPMPPARHLAALVRSLPVGIRGLLGAGILAATMSSIDSGINACSAAWLSDFQERLFGAPREDREEVHRGIVLTVAFGILAVSGSLGLMAWKGPHMSLFAVVNKAINGLGSPLLALILLGMFSRHVSASGMFWGGLLGIGASIYISLGVKGLSLHYYAVANLVVTVAACYAFSLPAVLRGRPATEAQLAWTWRGRREQMNANEGE